MSIFEYNARLHEETLKKEGYEDGREQGELKTLCSLIDDGILTIEQASDRMGMEPEEFLKKKEEELMPL